jgi:hypothetical protein
MNNIQDLEAKCIEVYKDLQNKNFYLHLVSELYPRANIIIMEYKFICETNFEKNDYQLSTVYKPVLAKFEKYAKYDFINEDSITFLNKNTDFNKIYRFDRNYKLHCYITSKTDKRLDIALPTFKIVIEYEKKECIIC